MMQQWLYCSRESRFGEADSPALTVQHLTLQGRAAFPA
jgi:hypothetical protein